MGQVSWQCEYRKVTTTGLPRSPRMETGRPCSSRSRKSGARASAGMVAPANVLPAATGGSSPRPLVAASTTPPSASAATSTSAIAIRGFTGRRLESQLPALPLHLAAPPDRVLRARHLEAGLAVQAAGRGERAEREQLEPLVAGRAGRLDHDVDQAAAGARPARLRAQREVPEPREAMPEVSERHPADHPAVELGHPEPGARTARPARPPQLGELERHVSRERRGEPVFGLEHLAVDPHEVVYVAGG